MKGSHSHPWPRPQAAWEPSVGSGVPSCLSDESAIDFPAVPRLVDGARRRFVDPPVHRETAGVGSGDDVGDSLTTTVEISRRAAATGAVVACELTLRDICPACGGRGESWSEPCLDCATVGHVRVRRHVRLAVPAGVQEGARYRFRLSRANQSSVKVDVRIVIH